DGLRTRPTFPDDHVAFDQVTAFKANLLRQSWQYFEESASDENRQALAAFERDNKWLPDWALFATLKERHNGAAWTSWPTPVAARLLQRNRPALGQPTVSMGLAPGATLPLVGVALPRCAAIRGHPARRSLPRLRRILGDPGRRADGDSRTLGARSGQVTLRRGAQRARQSAAGGRGPRIHHARGHRAAQVDRRAGDEGSAVRVRPDRQPSPAAQP